MSDIVERLIASSCSETCLMGKAATEITRLRRIEAAARKIVDYFDMDGDCLDRSIERLRNALGEE